MGTRIRQVQTVTKVVAGKPVVTPVLDGQGQEIELWSIDVPPELEAEGLPKDLDCSDRAAVEECIASELARLKSEREDKERQLAQEARRQAETDAADTAAFNALNPEE
jgi:hypothetical protein